MTRRRGSIEVGGRSVQERLYVQHDDDPRRRALGFYDRRGNTTWWSRAELFRRAATAAGELADAGLGRGDVCLVALPSGPPSAVYLTGALLVGALPLMLASPSLHRFGTELTATLRYVARKTRARVLLLEADLPAAAGHGLPRATRAIEAGTTPEPGDANLLPRLKLRPGDLAAMQLTSGTTGRPRVCTWSQRAVLAALDGMLAAMRLGRDDVCFNWTPLYHDMGLVNNFLLCLTSGVPMVLQSPTEFVQQPARWLRGLSDTRATVTWSPNFGFAIAAERAGDDALDGVRLDRVTSFWNAAERIHHATMVRFEERFRPYGLDPAALRTNFGCAENIGGATFSGLGAERYVVEHVDRDRLAARREARQVPATSDRAEAVVSAGRPYPGMEIVILGGNRRPLADGKVGEVALRTPSRMLGYLGDARATRRALRGGLLLTGDLGYCRDGELFWVGRVRERINIRGKKFDPSDFEPTLLAVPGLRAGCFAAFAVEDPKHGTGRLVIVAEVRCSEPAALATIADTVRQRCYERLDVTVGDVVLVAPGTLVKTSSGKRRHTHYARRYRDGELEEHRLNRGRRGGRSSRSG